MSTVTAERRGPVRTLGVLSVILGLIFIVAGAVTWGLVSSNLAAERITVAEDASSFAGQSVNSPWTAWSQADIIQHHALKASGGKTYAELDREDPVRDTMMTASFLRASLFTSVVSFGVALFAVGVGVLSLIVGWALMLLGRRPVAVAPAVAPAATTV